jgi:hypothetical protein
MKQTTTRSQLQKSNLWGEAGLGTRMILKYLFYLILLRDQRRRLRAFTSGKLPCPRLGWRSHSGVPLFSLFCLASLVIRPILNHSTNLRGNGSDESRMYFRNGSREGWTKGPEEGDGGVGDWSFDSPPLLVLCLTFARLCGF